MRIKLKIVNLSKLHLRGVFIVIFKYELCG